MRHQVAQLAKVQRHLFGHPIYSSIQTNHQMRLFMSRHVFAVWDFMTLLKSLQHHISCDSIIWSPPQNSFATNFIQGIVIGEECDKVDDALCLSHFELYLKAMKEINADTKQITKFVDHAKMIASRDHTNSQKYHLLMNTFDTIYVPPYVKHFVGQTLQRSLLMSGSDVHKIAAYFYYGREDPIPKMFQNFLDNIRSNETSYRYLQFYLQRHIDVDGSDHGPSSLKLLDSLTDGSKKKQKDVVREGIVAIKMRQKLWDGIYRELIF
jgi:hypothetical protein